MVHLLIIPYRRTLSMCGNRGTFCTFTEIENNIRNEVVIDWKRIVLPKSNGSYNLFLMLSLFFPSKHRFRNRITNQNSF